MPVSDYDPNSFVGRDDLVHEIVLRVAKNSGTRKLLVEGPANRGKSWLLCRIRDTLNDPALLTTIVASPPPLVATLFSSEDCHPFDLHKLVACLWLNLQPLTPALLQQLGPPPPPAAQWAPQSLSAHFAQRSFGFDPQQLLDMLLSELAKVNPQSLAVLIVDGLDEFSNLDSLERQFVEPLFRSSQVQIIASRRSEINVGWTTFLLKPSEKDLLNLEELSEQLAREQINRRFARHGSALQFDVLEPFFTYYRWQNPGANSYFVDQAVNQHQAEQTPLVSKSDIRGCILTMSQSGRFTSPVSQQDLDWLIEVVRDFPEIGRQDVPLFRLRATLKRASGGSPVEDSERNAWLSRLQERGIVVRRLNGQCQVYEEFVALCHEL